ncbi:MAG: energy transducer TonB [Planctomycetota bacterium]|nr:MAG: energy transducer TonB [Planctomycetota bacterium]
MWRVLAIAGAVLFHVAILLFGGLLFPSAQEDHVALATVELLAAEPVDEKEKPKDEPTEEARAQEDVEAPADAMPDLAEVLKDLEAPAELAPSLDAASLSTIASALLGEGGGGDLGFGGSMSFASGGVIGGTGKAGAALEASAGQAFDLAEIDQPPREIIKTPPSYPAEMRSKKAEGVVTLIFIVDDLGRVTEPKVAGSTHPAFEKPALQAVRQWKFEPAVRGGKRVPCRMRVPIRFYPSR